MTNDALIVAARNTFDTVLETLKQKSNEYNKAHDCFSAYRLAETLGVCTTEQDILGRVCEKFARLINRWKNNEAMEEEIHDLIGILVHLKELRRQ